MLLEVLFNFFYAVLIKIIGLLPSIEPFEMPDITAFLDMLSVMFIVINFDLFMFLIGNVVFWMSVRLIWSMMLFFWRRGHR